MRWSQGHVQHAEAGERIMYRCTISFQYQSAFEMDSVFYCWRAYILYTLIELLIYIHIPSAVLYTAFMVHNTTDILIISFVLLLHETALHFFLAQTNLLYTISSERHRQLWTKHCNYVHWSQGHVQHAEADERIKYRCTISFMYQSAFEMNSVFDCWWAYIYTLIELHIYIHIPNAVLYNIHGTQYYLHTDYILCGSFCFCNMKQHCICF